MDLVRCQQGHPADLDQVDEFCRLRRRGWHARGQPVSATRAQPSDRCPSELASIVRALRHSVGVGRDSHDPDAAVRHVQRRDGHGH